MLRHLDIAGQDKQSAGWGFAKEDLRARSHRQTLPRPQTPRFPTALPGGPEAGRDQGAGPPSQRWHSCGDEDRGEKVKTCRPLIPKGLGFPGEPIMAAVILVHGWPPAHGCCLHSSHRCLREHSEALGSQHAILVATVPYETW